MNCTLISKRGLHLLLPALCLSVVVGCGGDPAPSDTLPLAPLKVAEDQIAGSSIDWSTIVITALEAPGSNPGAHDTGTVGTDTWDINYDTARMIGFGVLNVPNIRLRLLSPGGAEVASVQSGEAPKALQVTAGKYTVEVINTGTESQFTRVGWFATSNTRAEFQSGLYADSSFGPAVERVMALRPLLGTIYKATPSDFAQKGTGQGSPYEDSDFCCEDFKDSWGPTGRNDIAKLKAAGVNFLHFYDWNDPNFTSGPNNFDRHHKNFLKYCATNGINYAVPISNYAIMNNRADIIRAIVTEVYENKQRLPGLIMWQVGNEYDNSGGQIPASAIARTAQQISQVEDDLGILGSERPAMTSPVTFGLYGASVEGVQRTNDLKSAFQSAGLIDIWKSRWIASVNSFNPGSDLSRWIPQFQQALNIPFCFFEVGKEIGGVKDGVYSPDNGDVHNEQQQGTWYQAQLNAILPFTKDSSSIYLGQCVFSFVNEAYKGGTEATFGVYRIGPSNGAQGTFAKNGWTYPLDNYAQKATFDVMKSTYSAAKNGF